MQRVDAFISAIEACPTPAHFVQWAESRLLRQGYVRVYEAALPETPPPRFFVIRDETAIVVFDIHDTDRGVFMVADIDSPGITVKPNSQIVSSDLEQLAVVGSAATQQTSWLDHDLNIAGRVWVRKDGKVEKKLVATKSPVCVIPSGPGIRGGSVETGYRPIIAFTSSFDAAQESQSAGLMAVLAKEAECNVDDIVDFEVQLVDSRPTELIGAKQDMLAGHRVDKLTSAFGGLLSLLEAGKCECGFRVFAGFDHSYQGSGLPNGSRGPLVERLAEWAGIKAHALSRSVVISLDNVNEQLPNHPNRFGQEPSPGVDLGSGPVLQQYRGRMGVTDVDLETQLMEIAKEADIKVTYFKENAKWVPIYKPGGGISMSLGIPMVVLGIPAASRHAIRSYALLSDFAALKDLAKKVWLQWNSREPISSFSE